MQNLRRLRCFVAVAEELHFRKAAERMFITQPALSQQIRQLESELGVALFDRDRRSVSLTEAGTVFLDPVREGLRHIDEGAAQLRSLSDESVERLRFGFVEYLNLPFLVTAFRELANSHPEISLETEERFSAQVISDLVEDELDIGIAFLPIAEPGIAWDPVIEGHWRVAVPDNHPFVSGETVDLADLCAEPLVMFARHLNPPFHDALMSAVEAAGHTPAVAYRVTQAAAGPRYVSEGLGLFIHASYILSELPTGVVSRPIAGLPPLNMVMAWHTQRTSPAIDAFRHVVAEVIARA